MAENVRITDVANAAGVSQSTASFVLGGKGDEMHISKETQELVWQTSRKLGYRPRNIIRRMRAGKPTEGIPHVTIYWAGSDALAFPQLARTFGALRSAIVEKQLNANVVLKSFVEGRLGDVLEKDASHYFSGTIVGGATQDDIDAISRRDSKEPIVFIDRKVRRFNSVYTDQRVGDLIAQRLCDRGFESAALLLPSTIQITMAERRDEIRQGCKERGIRCQLRTVSPVQDNFQGGRELTRRLMNTGSPPQVLVYLHEDLALSGIGALHEMGLCGGRDVEVIAFSSASHLAYLGMPVSLLQVPVAELANRAVDVLIEMLEEPDRETQNIGCGFQVTFAGRLAE